MCPVASVALHGRRPAQPGGGGREAAGATAAVAAGAGEASESSESEPASEDVTATARAALGVEGRTPHI